MKKSRRSKSMRIPVPPGCETALLSGRFGDCVYYVRKGRQFRRKFVVPKDRRTPAHLRTREIFGSASKFWSHSLEVTDQHRLAWETAANRITSRPRLQQSGPLTGQQYFVGRACALAGKSSPAVTQASKRAVSRGSKPAGRARARPTGMAAMRPTGMAALPRRRAQPRPRPQVARAQGVARATPEPRYTFATPTRGMGAAVTGTARLRCRSVSTSTRPRAGVAGHWDGSRLAGAGACRIHPPCVSGACIARLRCGTRKALASNA